MPEPTNSHPLWEQWSNSRLVRYLLLFALGWAITQVLLYFEAVIIIFIFSGILAFLLHYPVRWLTRYIPRSGAVIIVFLITLLFFAALISTLGLAIISQAQQLLNQAPVFYATAIDFVETMQDLLTRWNLKVNFNGIEDQIRDQVITGVGFGFSTLQGVLASLLDMIIIAVVAFFMLLDGGNLWEFLLKALPEKHRQNFTIAVKRNFIGFFWGRLILSVFFGVSVFIVFLLLDVPYALFLAAIAGVFDLIPGIGATLGISLVSVILLPQGIFLSLKVLVSCVLLQQVEENLLMPRVMQGSVNLNPVIMFLALLMGARIAGLVGIFLAIPIAGVVVSLLKIDEMQSNGENLKPAIIHETTDESN